MHTRAWCSVNGWLLQARELLEAICTSRFAEAFRILDEMKPALQMDPFLSNHLSRLTHQIRCRVLQQYTKPFHSLRLSDMAQALGCKLNDLEVELARLIVDETIDARIDSHNKVCVICGWKVLAMLGRCLPPAQGLQGLRLKLALAVLHQVRESGSL